MTQHFEVIGDDEGLHGDVMGEILGVDPAPGRQRVAIARRPHWRGGQWAPGVNAPQEGQVPLQLTPNVANGIFSSTNTSITFVGRMQKPYRAERILMSQTPIGTSAVGLQVITQIFVGVDLQQATTQPVNITLLGAATAFGVRMTLAQAPPGVEISLNCTLFPANPAGTDTLGVSIMFLGRIVH